MMQKKQDLIKEELKFPGTLRNHNVFNFINVHKYIGLKPKKP